MNLGSLRTHRNLLHPKQCFILNLNEEDIYEQKKQELLSKDPDCDLEDLEEKLGEKLIG